MEEAGTVLIIELALTPVACDRKGRLYCNIRGVLPDARDDDTLGCATPGVRLEGGDTGFKLDELQAHVGSHTGGGVGRVAGVCVLGEW